MASPQLNVSSEDATPTKSDNRLHDDIPLAVKISLPAGIFLLALIITVLVCVRYSTCCRSKKIKDEDEEIDMYMVGPPEEATGMSSRRHQLLPVSEQTRTRCVQPARKQHPTPLPVSEQTSSRCLQPARQQHPTEGLQQHLNEVHHQNFNEDQMFPNGRYFPKNTRVSPGFCEVTVHNTLYSGGPFGGPVTEAKHNNNLISNTEETKRLHNPGEGTCKEYGVRCKGYITMSSLHGSPDSRCMQRNDYITARHEKPVNVCQPLARDEPLQTGELNPVLTPPAKKKDGPIYDVLNKYRRRKPSRAESLHTNRPLDKKSRQRYQYDSLPLLPVEMKVMDIPIGPFLSSVKTDRNLSETIDQIERQKSFEDMFAGAWWHDKSQEDLSEATATAPEVPCKMRYASATLPTVNKLLAQRPASYVTMKQRQSGVQGGRYEPYPGKHKSPDSYMTHGQMMRVLKVCGVDAADDVPKEPPPLPCRVSHDYVNAKAGKQTVVGEV